MCSTTACNAAECGMLPLDYVPTKSFIRVRTIEQLSETEVRIRKAVITPEDELGFHEESAQPLSDRDRDLFLALLDNPPEPTEALRRAARRRRPRHG